jgi:hypothetical protein
MLEDRVPRELNRIDLRENSMMRSCIKMNTCYSDYHFKYAAKSGACGTQRNIQ